MVEGTREPGIWCVMDYISYGMLPICQMTLETLALRYGLFLFRNVTSTLDGTREPGIGSVFPKF